jgi:hypothetical protein
MGRILSSRQITNPCNIWERRNSVMEDWCVGHLRSSHTAVLRAIEGSQNVGADFLSRNAIWVCRTVFWDIVDYDQQLIM